MPFRPSGFPVDTFDPSGGSADRQHAGDNGGIHAQGGPFSDRLLADSGQFLIETVMEVK
jgi:hypothetical protein